MISIEKLIGSLNNFNDKGIQLPPITERRQAFIQKTAYDIRREELETLRNVAKVETEVANRISDYTMSKEFGIKPNNKQIKQTIEAQNPKVDSNLTYAENAIIDVPQFLKDIAPLSCYLYGVKNPNSFFKSVLMLNNPEYILKTNADKVIYATTFKRSIAVQLDELYRHLKYHQWNFKKLDMVNQLLNETTLNYALIIATADYIKKSILIFDIVKKEYQIYPSLVGGVRGHDETGHEDFFMIIKDGNTYLPLMNGNGSHSISPDSINQIKASYILSEVEHPFKVVRKVEVVAPVIPNTSDSSVVQAIALVVAPKAAKYIESKMTLINLQELAKVRGIDITKEGKQGKQIAKTKKELCDELNIQDFGNVK